MALIDELLDLSKIEAGRISLSLEPVVCSEVITESLTLVRPLADKRNLALEYECRGQLEVHADRVRLKQVLVNLLSNAVKYNKESGGRVKVTAVASGDRVRFSVADTGEGLSAEQIANLYVPFDRLGREAGEIEGSGLGLAFTKRLVELMNGEIAVQSQIGEGSTFSVTLPSPRSTSPEVPESTLGAQPVPTATRFPTTAGGKRGGTVLYIEGNPSDVRLVTSILANVGAMKLLTAHDSRLGLELAELHIPELILLDPDTRGIEANEFIDTLRASEWGAEIPVVALTARAMPEEVASGNAVGFEAYLTKPLDLSKFLKVVERSSSAS